jgi:hypothetical protein
MCVILYVLYGGLYCVELVIDMLSLGGFPAHPYILGRGLHGILDRY